jgi:lysophospholipase L1-like esterase
MESPLTSRTARALLWTVLFALAALLLPGPASLHWWPKDWHAFVPRLFVGQEQTQVAEGALPASGDQAPAEVDDTQVLALADNSGALHGELPPQIAPISEAAPDEPPEAAGGSGGGGGGGDDGQVFQAGAPLPAPPSVSMTAAGIPLLPIEDPQGAMNRFYASLDRTASGAEGAITRILHYGDSLIMGDYVTQTVRRLMQKKFGDAGHGFVLAGMPFPWYRRENLKLSVSDGWHTWRLTTPTNPDGLYGLGGATFQTKEGNQWVRFEPDGTELGTSASHFQVFYLAQPWGGDFKMAADDRELVVHTRADAAGARVAEVTVPDGKHVFKLTTTGSGPVRLFGAVLERDGPGVVYDSLGINGARASLLTRFQPEHWHDQIKQRHPDLLVLHFGTNESQDPNMGAKRYREELSGIVGQLRQALPGVSCLIVSPLDRAEVNEETGELGTRPVVKRIVQVQREVAYAQGCAFWNTWQAMGGEGSMARWMRMSPPLGGGDLTHPTPRGADRVGAMLFAAIMDGYRRYHDTAHR